MAVEYIVTDADVGMVFPAEHHYLLSLIRSRGPYQDVHRANWHERHFVLRDSKSPQNLYCIDAVNYGRVPLTIGGAQFHAINTCIPFHGALTLVSVPLGSEWEIVLSEVYVRPLPPLYPTRSWGYAPNGMWGNYPSYRNSQQQQQRQQRKQLALSAPPLQLTSPVTEKIEGA